MDCKLALEESGGDLSKATETLRRKGFAQAAKRSDNATSQGLVEAYIHTGGRVGALVELGCETDFVARTPEFRELAHNLAMQIAAMAPQYVDQSQVQEGDGRPTSQTALLNQPFIKDSSRTVSELVQELAAKVGENVKVLRFTRLALGE
ncbi:MAG: elongation factor Ts [Dehalococcoidia bacterium]|nr:elongation factor Ts [Dehalococcoidia bacterium]MSQ16703.1 elongation factor Ts [Dehalococcoidia bacterium]